MKPLSFTCLDYKTMPTPIISIEGNIGSGKSTLVELLRNRLGPHVTFVPEPVPVWNTIRDSQGETILAKFYADQKAYSFSFQMMAYISRVSALRQAIRENPHGVVITERSVQTDRNVFAKMLFDQEQIREVDYQIYLKWFDEFSADLPIGGMIYVNASPSTCQQRVAERNREGESIPLEYLKKCHEYHQSWVTGFNSEMVCKLDGEMNVKDDPAVAEAWVEEIVQFLRPDEIGLMQSVSL